MKNVLRIVLLSLPILPSCLFVEENDAEGFQPAPSELMVEMIEYPEKVKIQATHPQYSWMMNSSLKGDYQTAYRILVDESEEDLEANSGKVWDSGKTPSDKNLHILHGGLPLKSNRTYYWKVMVWNKEDEASYFSGSQKFSTGTVSSSYHTERYPLETTGKQAIRIVKKGEGRYFVDFGKVAFARPVLMLEQAADSQLIVLHLAEQALSEDSINTKPEGTVRYQRMDIYTKAGQKAYEGRIVPDERNTGPMAIKLPEGVPQVMPFRYCEVVGYPGELGKEDIKQVVLHYHFNDAYSQFESSDTLLNEIWQLCKYTMKATSFLGVYVDGDRERIPYEADAYINQLGHYYTDREYTLARYTHEYLLDHPTWPTEWLFHSVMMAWADYLYTGNTESLTENYKKLKLRTLLPLAREDGLISTQEEVNEELYLALNRTFVRDIVDWPPIERDGYEMVKYNTVVNAFYLHVLRLMSDIAKITGHDEDARQFAAQYEKAHGSFQDVFFDNEKGLYRDGEGSDHYAIHASMFPLAFGLVPDSLRPGILEYIESKGMAVSVYGAQYLLEALYANNRGDYAYELLTAKSKRSWYNMIHRCNATIAMEAWDPEHKPNLDYNHAWGAAPANIIPAWLMGIRPLEPGFRKFIVQPRPGPLSYARLMITTISGFIESHIRQGKNRFKLYVDIPPNTTADIYLPKKKKGGTVFLNGEKIKTGENDYFYIFKNVSAGEYYIELRY